MTAARTHQCEACGAVEVWSDGWSSYGSIVDDDAGLAVVTCPQPGCKAQAPGLLRRKPKPPPRPLGYG
jgi:hypothetical protein